MWVGSVDYTIESAQMTASIAGRRTGVRRDIDYTGEKYRAAVTLQRFARGWLVRYRMFHYHNVYQHIVAEIEDLIPIEEHISPIRAPAAPKSPHTKPHEPSEPEPEVPESLTPPPPLPRQSLRFTRSPSPDDELANTADSLETAVQLTPDDREVQAHLSLRATMLASGSRFEATRLTPAEIDRVESLARSIAPSSLKLNPSRLRAAMMRRDDPDVRWFAWCWRGALGVSDKVAVIAAFALVLTERDGV
ncbi:hypothetical protein J8273_4717 [Carpediemonas membranifera]|uniref:Uncharacterized protein n=1 Tax=Carpediemonas membranifera TaxID=201153 RepID=A0A8J6B636_9EUKA|nr:hypothetical protein J8273_4717 [Carpediemonas membranifera]|eukprot:KAG9393854.1 hypothetical protein J8273_4717 [Carpediemonas membranifera]